MFPTISESTNGFLSLGLLSGAFSGFSNGSLGGSGGHANGAVNGHRSLTEEEQHLYNHHIIENFVESVREMNDVVLIPSKLQDLDPAVGAPAPGSKVQVELNDDLYSYYQMINVVKNDLFEPHSDDSMKKQFFQFPKRKISRQHRREEVVPVGSQVRSHSRNLSGSSLSSMLQNHNNNNNNNKDILNNNNNPVEVSKAGKDSDDGSITPPPNPLMPLTADQLVGQSAKQLTFSFIHHLHSLYTILEHFTKAADFITERYQREVESNI